MMDSLVMPSSPTGDAGESEGPLSSSDELARVRLILAWVLGNVP